MAFLSLVVATEISLQTLLLDALIYAKLKGFDVCTVENTHDSTACFEELKFGAGDGTWYHISSYRQQPPQHVQSSSTQL